MEDCHRHRRWIANVIVYCVILLLASYCLGYLTGKSFSTVRKSTFVISGAGTRLVSMIGLREGRVLGRASCAEPIPSEITRQMVLDWVYGGNSLYETYTRAKIRAYEAKGLDSNDFVLTKLVLRVQPKTIIEVGSFMGELATKIANLTTQMGLKTRILCIQDFHQTSKFDDLFVDTTMSHTDLSILHQFIQNIISSNATKSILPLPFSTTVALDELCQWGVYGDLVVVNIAPSFRSTWFDINRAYKLVRPGGVLVGRHKHTSYKGKRGIRAFKLFAQINGFGFKLYRGYWVIGSTLRAPVLEVSDS